MRKAFKDFANFPNMEFDKLTGADDANGDFDDGEDAKGYKRAAFGGRVNRWR